MHAPCPTESPSRISSELLTEPTCPEPAKLAEWIERAALCDLFAAAPERVRNALGLCVAREHGALGLCAPGSDSAWVNRMFIGGTGEPASPEDVHALLERLERLGARRTFAHGYGDDPAIESALAAHGLQRYARPWVKLVRGRTPLPKAAPGKAGHEAGHGLRPAALEDAPAFVALIERCFGMPSELAPVLAALVQRPRWHVFLAFEGRTAIGTGALFVHGNVGYLGFGAVAPEQRGRGVQRALLEKRMRVAYALGCGLVVSETGVALPGQRNPSHANMLALGMTELALRQNYARAGLRFE